MNSKITFIVIAIVILLVGVLLMRKNAQPTSVNPVATPNSASVTANGGKFNPSSIEYSGQQELQLDVYAQDADYNFNFPELGLNQTLPQGETTMIDLNGLGVGTFTFTCGVSCEGTITVHADIDADHTNR